MPRKPTTNPRKISATRRSSYACSRRAVPPQNARKIDVKALMERETKLIETLLRDDETRASVARGMGEDIGPLTVWNEYGMIWATRTN